MIINLGNEKFYVDHAQKKVRNIIQWRFIYNLKHNKVNNSLDYIAYMWVEMQSTKEETGTGS